MKDTGISKEKGEGFREEEDVKVDFVKAKDYLVAVMDEAAHMQKENKLLSEELQAERIAREKAEQTIRELQEKLDVWVMPPKDIECFVGKMIVKH